jgi:hypothetical protein
MQTIVNKPKKPLLPKDHLKGAVPGSAKGYRVVVPDAVVLPLPKAPRDEISVPASINGRDLSTGRL